MIKKMCVLVVILFPILEKINAQETNIDSVFVVNEKDTVFDGVEFTAGRIVRGFGSSFEQSLASGSEQFRGTKNDQSSYFTNPSGYIGLGRRGNFQISYTRSWAEQEQDEPNNKRDSTGIEPKGPITNTTRFQTHLRPSPEFDIKLRGYLTSTEQVQQFDDFLPSFEVAFNDIFKNKQFDFQGVYLSDGGLLKLTPTQRRWVHYANTQDFFKKSFSDIEEIIFEDPIIFLSKDQKMNSFSGGVQYVENNSAFGRTENKTWFGDINFLYGFRKHFMMGLSVKPTYTQSSSDGTFLSIDSTGTIFFESGANIETDHGKRIKITPRIDYLSSNETLHRLIFQYDLASLRVEENDRNIPLDSENFNSTTTRWSVAYSFHRLWNAETPSLDTYLANWNHLFGNPLPRGAFYFFGEIFINAENHSGSDLRRGFYGFIPRSAETFRSFNTYLTSSYGVSDWLELGWKTQISRSWSKVNFSSIREEENDATDFWFNRMLWKNLFFINITNFRYSEKYAKHFGWYQISPFNQLYGPLLLRGMFKAAIVIQPDQLTKGWTSKSAQYLKYSLPDQKRDDHFIESDIQLGLGKNVQLSTSGSVSVRSSTVNSRNTFKRQSINNRIAIIWQPWKTLRFEVEHHYSEQKFNDSLRDGSLRRNELIIKENRWNLRVVSLFL